MALNEWRMGAGRPGLTAVIPPPTLTARGRGSDVMVGVVPAPTLTVLAERVVVNRNVGLVTHCVNLSNGGATRWPWYGFSRIWRVGGRFYGVSPTGLFLLEGDTDLGERVTKVVQTHPNNLQPEGHPRDVSMSVKHVHMAYIDSHGGCSVAGWFEDAGSFGVAADVVAKRVKLGRGVRGRNFTLRIEAAAAFRLTAVQLIFSVLGRGYK